MPIPSLHTPRLLLQPLQLADAEQIQPLFGQWEVVRYLNAQVPWPYPADGALVYLRDVALPAMAAGSEWHWTLRPGAEPARVIGVISLMDTPGNNRGFWIAPAWQRQGLMSEACVAVNRYWFEVLQRPEMQVPKAVENIASRRLSEREGMRLVATGESHYVSGRLPSQTWALSREEWLNRQT
ncbi:GNAT family N-acetyltransferase [Pseudomonas sp. D1-3]